MPPCVVRYVIVGGRSCDLISSFPHICKRDSINGKRIRRSDPIFTYAAIVYAWFQVSHSTDIAIRSHMIPTCFRLSPLVVCSVPNCLLMRNCRWPRANATLHVFYGGGGSLIRAFAAAARNWR